MVCLAACSKKDKKQYLTWTVNGETFSTNQIEVAIGKAQCGLASHDANNRFTLGFDIGYALPTEGVFDLNTFSPGVQLCGITFYYNSKFYYHTSSIIGHLYASSVNGKASYTLPPSWFVSYENPTTDSIQINGEFNEP